MTNFEGDPILSDDELRTEFAALFPHGWAGPDVLAELTPGGWAASPLVAVFHPSAQQQYEESLRVHRNLASLRRPDAEPPSPEPTLAEFEAGHEDGPVDPERECRELVGLCLWDLFGDNHEAFAADGRKLDLGSMRSAGGFLAEVLNAQGARPLPRPELDAMTEQFLARATDGSAEAAAFLAEMRKEMLGDGGYTYLDFYLGTHMVAGRADLRPVYEMIFRRMRGRGMDWAYTFPRLYAVDFRPLKKRLDEQARGDEPEFAGYDPSAALEQEQADREHDESLAELREQLDEGHRESVAAAQDADPPATVQAYRAVYGELPRGWPPEA